MGDSKDIFDLGKDPRNELIVALHGFRRANERLTAVRAVIRKDRPAADIFAPKLAVTQNLLSFKKVESIVAELVDKICNKVTERERSGGKYESIRLVGHSFGAVLARKIAILAFGEQKDKAGNLPAPFEEAFERYRSPRDWADRIGRIVLLAGLNRGWSVSNTMDSWTSAKWSALQLLGETIQLLPRAKATIFAIRKGAPFLVHTRLQWLALMDPKNPKRPKNLITVQLLGNGDVLVSPDDNVDYSVDLSGTGDAGVSPDGNVDHSVAKKLPQSYFYLEVEKSDHDNVIDMSETEKLETKSERADESAPSVRRKIFLSALRDPADVLSSTVECIHREYMADNLPPDPKPYVTDVVFVVHGIRDKGFWTQKVARNIKRIFAEHHPPTDKQEKLEIESWTESYGYFAMLPFVLRPVRQRKVEWLMDRYVEARARYPNAAFHYVGHSNGTYLVAQALCDYPAARFKHIVFAGSVVRRDYDWSSFTKQKPPRVEKVLNFVATQDWVVALVPKALQQMQIWRRRRIGLGSAGHDGFDQDIKNVRVEQDPVPVHQVKYIVGGHGSGVEESNWDHIAKFIVSGKPPAKEDLQDRRFREKPNKIICFLGAISFILFSLLMAIVLLVGAGFLWWTFAHLPCELVPFWHEPALRICTADPTAREAAWRTIGFFVYLLSVFWVVTRV